MTYLLEPLVEGGLLPSCQRLMQAASVSSSCRTVSTNHYQHALDSLANDPRVQKDLDVGRRVGLYRLGMKIGTGAYAHVKLGNHILTSDSVAVKIINVTNYDEKCHAFLKEEIHVMRQIQHEHVIELYEIIQSPSRVHIVMEFASGGDMFTKILANGPFKEYKASVLFSQILSGVQYLHTKNIIHRDLKPENILFASQTASHIKIADMGFSVQVQSHQQKLTAFCGSPPYAAPELFLYCDYEGRQVDIWALGTLLYYMVAGHPPFLGDGVPAIKSNVLQINYRNLEHHSQDVNNLIASILIYDPVKRPAIHKIRQHVWFKKACPMRVNKGMSVYGLIPKLPDKTNFSPQIVAYTQESQLVVEQKLKTDPQIVLKGKQKGLGKLVSNGSAYNGTVVPLTPPIHVKPASNENFQCQNGVNGDISPNNFVERTSSRASNAPVLNDRPNQLVTKNSINSIYSGHDLCSDLPIVRPMDVYRYIYRTYGTPPYMTKEIVEDNDDFNHPLMGIYRLSYNKVWHQRLGEHRDGGDSCSETNSEKVLNQNRRKQLKIATEHMIKQAKATGICGPSAVCAVQ